MQSFICSRQYSVCYIEDHIFGPINLREHFPEEELTLGKNRFLEVASLVE